MNLQQSLLSFSSDILAALVVSVVVVLAIIPGGGFVDRTVRTSTAHSSRHGSEALTVRLSAAHKN